MKMTEQNGLRLAVSLVLVLFIAQIFAPFVVAQTQSEDNDTAAMAGNLTLPVNVSKNTALNTSDGVIKRNRISFVLGTAENLLSLENASIDAAVNATIEVMIYNATEAKSADFSNESVVFLASLDNETVANINQTLNESAYVFAYNLTTNVSIGNVDDVNITKYWDYGSDENIRNLIVYMTNLFYGHTADPQMLAEEDRPKVVFIIGGESYVPMLINAGANSSLNATVYTSKRLPPELNLTTYELIFLEMIGAGITPVSYTHLTLPTICSV